MKQGKRIYTTTDGAVAEEPADTQLAFAWHLGKFLETRRKKHAYRLLVLAGLSATDPATREAIDAIAKPQYPSDASGDA